MLVQIDNIYKLIVSSYPCLCRHFKHSCKKFNILMKRSKIFLQTITILAWPLITKKKYNYCRKINANLYNVLLPSTTFFSIPLLACYFCIPLSPLRNIISFLFLYLFYRPSLRKARQSVSNKSYLILSTPIKNPMVFFVIK